MNESKKVSPIGGDLEGAFKNYLHEKRYSPSTVNGHLQNINYFMQWIEANELYEAENIRYNDLLNYVQYEQQKNITVQTINLRLGSISKYYEFLKKENIAIKNPAKTLRIKGRTKSVTEQPLQYDELVNLYNIYKSLKKESLHQHKTNLAHERNIVIVGMLVWQGLHSGELQRLETTHINLQEGIIYIPSTSRSNSRELRLHTQQILSLHHYIYHTREQLKPIEEELIPGNVHNTTHLLTEELKGINPKIKNALHIRSSVILHWLRQHNKRQVQYMIGHKYIDSTEKYKVQELESLTQSLSKHHPFG
jgi:site-specific recombinase XerD